MGVVIISSPWPRPDTIMARWSPAVQEWRAIAYLVPMYFLNMSSNLATLGPVESQPERRVSTTSFISASSILGLPKMRKFFRMGLCFFFVI